MNKPSVQAAAASLVWLPQRSEHSTILDFLCKRFNKVSRENWCQRMATGKVAFVDGPLIRENTPYKGDCRISYYREVASEVLIPFEEKILFESENLLLVDKPHFLPVHPAGQYIEQCLTHRLKVQSGNSELTPVHRIDRLTAGLILFCKNPELRGLYQQMFSNGEVEKRYQAVGKEPLDGKSAWSIANRLVPGEPWFRMQAETGEPNSFSDIEVLQSNNGFCLYQLKPNTGKKHQLRVHMSKIAGGILYDPFYPELSEEGPDDYTKPLQLLAQALSFTDPVSGEKMCFESQLKLKQLVEL